MRKLIYAVIALTTLFITTSCSNDYEETNDEVITTESTELVNYQLTDLTVKPLSQISDPLLLNQIDVTKEQLTNLLPQFDRVLTPQIIADASLDIENVLVSNFANNVKSYTFTITIPKEKGSEDRELEGYLTLNFDGVKNLNNYLQFDSEELIYFDQKGSILDRSKNATRDGYYSPKPSNKPSKAPKSVICNYHWNGSIPSVVASYCGFYFGGTGPAPIHVLAALFPEWYIYINGQWVELDTPREIIPLTNDYNDLYYLLPDGSTGGFSVYFYYVQLQGLGGLHNEIINYYNQVYVSQLGYAITNPYSQTYEEDHVHKQAFLDSFLDWIYEMQTFAPGHYSYLASNPSVFYQIFNFFADYNLNNPVDEPTYFGQPWYVVQYTPNQDVKCINNGSDYLLTPAGLTLMQNLGSGSINIEDFRDALPDCN